MSSEYWDVWKRQTSRSFICFTNYWPVVLVRTDNQCRSRRPYILPISCCIPLISHFQTFLQHLLRFPAPISGNLYSKRYLPVMGCSSPLSVIPDSKQRSSTTSNVFRHHIVCVFWRRYSDWLGDWYWKPTLFFTFQEGIVTLNTLRILSDTVDKKKLSTMSKLTNCWKTNRLIESTNCWHRRVWEIDKFSKDTKG